MSFEEVVQIFEKLRNQGNPDVEKKRDVRNFSEITSIVEVPSHEEATYISLGYLERLMRKLLSLYPEEEVKNLSLKKWKEACGYFEGRISFQKGEKAYEIDFSWEGRGPILTTWDQFTRWEEKVISSV